MSTVFVVLLVSAGILAGPGPALGHGAGCRLDQHGESVIVRFYYSGEEPMSYAEVIVFGPGDPNTLEHQNGRTDKNGVFAFVPDREGVWEIEAKDGMGHSTSLEVVWPRERKGSGGIATNQGGSPWLDSFTLLLKAASGVLLLFVLFASLRWFRSRFKSKS